MTSLALSEFDIGGGQASYWTHAHQAAAEAAAGPPRREDLDLMAGVSVKRPRTTSEIRALIRERTRNIERLEAALRLSLPAQDRKHLQQRLAGEKNNRQSWIDYLAKENAA